MNAIILSGGSNSRILMNKAFINIGGKPIIETLIERLSPLFRRIIIVTNSNQEYEYLVEVSSQVDLATDIIAGKGPLGGVYSGLCSSASEYNFVVGCDMPFINVSLIQYMIENVSGYDVVVPKVDNLLEPLHAIYSKKCISPIKNQLNMGELSLLSLFKDVKVRFIEKSEAEKFSPDIAFFNINNPRDLEKARRIVDESRGLHL